MENNQINFDRYDFDDVPTRLTHGCGDCDGERGYGFDERVADDFYIQEPRLYGSEYIESQDAWVRPPMDSSFYNGYMGGAEFPGGMDFTGDSEYTQFPEFAQMYEREPECPEKFNKTPCPERCPDRDNTPEPPYQPDELAQLRGFMDSELSDAVIYHCLASRLPHCVSRTLLCMESDERRHLKKLRAEYFLLTGCRYSPHCPDCRICSPIDTLRSHCEAELESERAYLDAAQSAQRDDLARLYRCLAADEARHASCITRMVEALLGEKICCRR